MTLPPLCNYARCNGWGRAQLCLILTSSYARSPTDKEPRRLRCRVARQMERCTWYSKRYTVTRWVYVHQHVKVCFWFLIREGLRCAMKPVINERYLIKVSMWHVLWKHRNKHLIHQPWSELLYVSVFRKKICKLKPTVYTRVDVGSGVPDCGNPFLIHHLFGENHEVPGIRCYSIW